MHVFVHLLMHAYQSTYTHASAASFLGRYASVRAEQVSPSQQDKKEKSPRSPPRASTPKNTPKSVRIPTVLPEGSDAEEGRLWASVREKMKQRREMYDDSPQEEPHKPPRPQQQQPHGAKVLSRGGGEGGGGAGGGVAVASKVGAWLRATQAVDTPVKPGIPSILYLVHSA